MTYLLEEKANIYKEEKNNKRQDYESLLVKLEADIREHIKIEHQMKLCLDDLELEKEELKYKNKLKKLKIEQLIQKLNTYRNNEEDQSLIIIKHEDTSINSSNDTKTEKESTVEEGKFRRFEEEILELKKKVVNFEEKNKNLSNNIKKLREECDKKDKELEEIENKHKNEIKLLKKQLQIYENRIKQLSEENVNFITKNKNMTTKKNFFKPNKSNTSIKILNDIESNNSFHKKISVQEELSSIYNKTTSIRKSQPNSLSANSSIDKIEKYIKRKFSTLKVQKTQRTSSVLKLRKKEKNNSVLNKKKTEDLMKLFLNDSNHQNLTERIRSSKLVQKSDDNLAYYNQYCNKSKLKKDKKTIFKDVIISNSIKKGKANFGNKNNYKDNLIEMVNNINNINIFANNLKQSNNNMMYFKSNLNNSNNNTSFHNIYKYDILKQYKNKKK